ncbi:MAG TPA: winged helix-turn-helix domain-containing protein [Terriglobales bacterium]|nr:winged helix-turn-helix domain-containing protein [Terriglobales bacterium]
MAPEINELYEFGDFRLEGTRRLLRRQGEAIPLTSKAFDTLLVLVRNRDRVLLKDELMKALWPDSFVEEVNLAQNISALRKALGESPGENRYIATVPGRGYRFVCPVANPAEPEQELVVERHTTAQILIQEESEAEEAGVAGKLLPAPRPGWERIALGVLAAGLMAGGILFWRMRSGNAEAGTHSLAVLPFQSLAASGDDEHLGLGVTDAVITKLSNIHGLAVRPTDAVMRYAGGKVEPAQAAREMGVDSLLSGKIQKSGQRIRVTVQLVRVRDGRPLWAQSFDENLTSIFAVEDSISEKVAEALAVNLAEQDKEQLERHYTENIDAYRNYLEGRYAEFTFTRDGMNKAIAYFSQAIADDPSYALAYAGLADAYTTESDWLLSPREALPKAESAARKALAFDDNLAEGHEALAHALLHEWRLAEANREFHRALQLNPNSVSTRYTYAEYLASIGQADQAIAEMNKALTIDPLSPEVNSFLAWDYYLKRDYDGCLAVSQKAVQTFPDFWVPHLTSGMCHLIKRQNAEANQEFQKARAMNPESTFAMTGLGIGYARAGDKARARKILNEMGGLDGERYVSPVYVGLVYGALGERDREFDYLAKGYDDQAEWLLWLTFDPLFDDVRSDSRFKELVKKVGVAE